MTFVCETCHTTLWGAFTKILDSTLLAYHICYPQICQVIAANLAYKVTFNMVTSEDRLQGVLNRSILRPASFLETDCSEWLSKDSKLKPKKVTIWLWAQSGSIFKFMASVKDFEDHKCMKERGITLISLCGIQ